MSYHHLTIEERYQIKAYKAVGYKNHEIAKEINVHPSTIGRELKRNDGKLTNTYVPIWADNYAKKRKINQAKNANKKLTKELQILVEKYLKKDWSPEQVSGVLMSKHKINISHVSIYRFIYEDRCDGGELYKHLRHSNKKRAKYGTKYKGRIKDRVSISKRPKIVDDKSRIGDFEADTIIGAGRKGAIITIVDRKSMYLKISIPSTKKANETAKKMIKLLTPFKDRIHTITTDNGFEFAEHKKVAKSLNCDYYFCHPYCSWERGLNENINGLIRQYIPKGSSFEKLTKKDIQVIEDKLNHRPRKSLNWRTPYEVFHDIKIAS
jgi:IS30 family transposase